MQNLVTIEEEEEEDGTPRAPKIVGSFYDEVNPNSKLLAAPAFPTNPAAQGG
jgi:hypothetical protein